MNLQPPCSPISPSPPETEIPSMETRVQGYVDSGYFEQYGNIFYPDVSDPCHAPPPPEKYSGNVPNTPSPGGGGGA